MPQTDGHQTTEPLRVTAIRPQRRSTERANLYVDGEFRCGAAWEVLRNERIESGTVLSPSRLDALERADEQWKAKQSALSLLGKRPRARGELFERLQRKGYSSAACEWAISETDRLGLIDDAAFAGSWVRDRIRLRPRGARALLMELRRKGVSSETAHAAIEDVMRTEATSDDVLCQAAARKWLQSRTLGSTPDERRRDERRLAAFLTRRGYGSEAVRDAVTHALSGLPMPQELHASRDSLRK